MKEPKPAKRREVDGPHTSAAGGWGCPHDDRGACLKRKKPCQPGDGGCVLEGRLPSPTGR